MRLSQRRVVPAGQLTLQSSLQPDTLSSLSDPDNSAASANLSILVDASEVSHAIASTYHALTNETLRKHNRRQNSANLHSTRASHANQLSSSLEQLNVDLPSYLHTQTTQSMAGIAPMDHFEGLASFPFQQQSTYQALIVPLFKNIAQQTHPQLPLDDNFSMKAELGADDCCHAHGCNGDTTFWKPQEGYYVYATRNNKDMAEWGQNLAGVGAQFDANSGYIPPLYANGGCHES